MSTHEAYNLRVVTALRFANTVTEGVTNMTYLFDTNWDQSVAAVTGTTLPIAFFHVKAESSSQRNQISTKRVLVYESTKETKTDAQMSGVRPASLNAISDNIVVEHAQYELQVLVPYGAVTYIFSRLSAAIDSIPHIVMSIGGESVAGRLRDVMDQMISVSSMLKATVSAFTGVQNVMQKLGNFSSASLNADSLKNMARNRSVLLYKQWDSWNFKYVVIESIKLDKTGLDGNYLRGSIILREVPVLAVGAAQIKPSVSKGRSLIGNALQSALAKFVNASSSVMNNFGG